MKAGCVKSKTHQEKPNEGAVSEAMKRAQGHPFLLFKQREPFIGKIETGRASVLRERCPPRSTRTGD